MIHHKFLSSSLLLNRIMKMQQDNTGRESFSWDPAIQTYSQVFPLIVLSDASLCVNPADCYITGMGMHEGSLAFSTFFTTVFCSVEVCMKVFRMEHAGTPTATSFTCTYKPRLLPLMTHVLSLFSRCILDPHL